MYVSRSAVNSVPSGVGVTNSRSSNKPVGAPSDRNAPAAAYHTARRPHSRGLGGNAQYPFWDRIFQTSCHPSRGAHFQSVKVLQLPGHLSPSGLTEVMLN